LTGPGIRLRLEKHLLSRSSVGRTFHYEVLETEHRVSVGNLCKENRGGEDPSHVHWPTDRDPRSYSGRPDSPAQKKVETVMWSQHISSSAEPLVFLRNEMAIRIRQADHGCHPRTGSLRTTPWASDSRLFSTSDYLHRAFCTLRISTFFP